MSLIGNIDNIPVFTSIAEAELWGSQYNIAGHHTHTILGVTGYMAGTTHADITAADLTVVINPITPQQLMQATGATSTPSPTPTTSSSFTSSGGGGGGY
tara:strand:+ start:1005 stop:1301 length:297 start_codon:yes stop_codon:yes gene_type:complete